MAEIEKLSVRHQTIMDYMIVNPTHKLGEIANHFKMTQAWLSCVIHSDIFQAMLKQKMDEAFSHTVLPIRDKMEAVAHIALDKLAESLPMETDVRVINAVAENVLERIGFSSKPGSTVINNNGGNVQVNCLRSELDEARALLGKAERPKLEVVADGVVLPVQISSEASLGEANQGVLPALPSNEGHKQTGT